MSVYKTRKKMEAAGGLMPPTWHTYHEIGVRIIQGGKLPAHATYEEMAKVFGGTKQNIYHELAVAIGKLTYRLRQAVAEPEPDCRRAGDVLSPNL